MVSSKQCHSQNSSQGRSTRISPHHWTRTSVKSLEYEQASLKAAKSNPAVLTPTNISPWILGIKLHRTENNKAQCDLT